MTIFSKIGRLLTKEEVPAEEQEVLAQPSGQPPAAIDSPLIEDIVNAVDSSVRLRNCLKNPNFPFKTLAEYLGHNNALEAVKRVQNAGKKTANELDTLIQDFLSQPDKYTALRPTAEPEKTDLEDRILNAAIELFAPYKFPETIFSLNISVRLANVLQGVQEDKNNPFQTLADCLSHPEKITLYFLSRQSMGRKTLVELKELIGLIPSYILEKYGFSTDEQEYISTLLKKESTAGLEINQDALLEKLHSINTYASPIDLLLFVPQAGILDLEHSDAADDAAISSLMRGILNEREFDVVSRRTSFGHKKVDTLEEISVAYNCTRERIRQIEKKALRKLSPLKKIFVRALEEEQLEIEEALFEGADYFFDEEQARQFKRLPGKYQLAILVAYKEFDAYLAVHHKEYKRFWIKPSISEDAFSIVKEAIDSGNAANSVKKRITEALYKLSWPIQLRDLEAALPEISSSTILASLRTDFDAEISDESVKIPADRLKSSLRLILTLRYASRAVTLSEARYFHNQIFETDINEHMAGAVLGRLEEALIVDRGKYALYENISLLEKDIAAVRNSCWKYLNKSQAYASTKRIFDDLFLGQHSFGAEFNPYMVLGILQDDSRFVCKRGLMLGLNTFSEDDFIGLNEQIYEIVNNHGPIDVRGIQQYLSESRKVLDVTVGMMLDASPEHIKVAPSTYDQISRALGDEDTCLKLKYAVEIALIDNDLSLFSLQERIACVGFDLNKHVVLSWLDKQENIDRNKSIIHLASLSTEVGDYNKKYLHLKETCSSSDLHLDAMSNALKADSPFIAEADYRLTGKALSSTTVDSSEGNELDNLFKEFDF